MLKPSPGVIIYELWVYFPCDIHVTVKYVLHVWIDDKGCVEKTTQHHHHTPKVHLAQKKIM